MKKAFGLLLALFFSLPLHLYAGLLTEDKKETDAQRYQYFFLEAMRKQSMGDYVSAFELLRHAIGIKPASPEAHYQMAKYLLQMQQDSLAVASLEKAVALSPKNEDYQETLARLYFGTGNTDKAIDAYTRLCDVHSDRTDGLKVLLHLWQQKKNYAKMLEILDRLERAEGESEDITLTKVMVYEMTGDSLKAYGVLKQIADKHPYDISYRVMLGNWLLQKGRNDEAFDVFTKALSEEPNNAGAQSSLYDYYRQIGDTVKASDMMERILVGKATPTENKLQMLRQAIQDNEQQGGDSIKMMQLFDKIIEASPDDTGLLEMKIAYMTMKKFGEPEINAVFTQLLEKAPDNAGARFQLIQGLWSSEKWDEMLEMSIPGMLYNPDEMAFYYFSGVACFQKGDEDRALGYFRKGVAEINDKSDPNIVSEFYSIMGEILYRKGLHNEAFAAFDSCLQWKPDNISSLNNYAYYLSIDGKDLKKAEEMSVKTIQAEPMSTTYLDTYAWILFRQQRYEEARIYIDRAISNDSTEESHPDIYEHAGDIYALSGNMDKAVGLWTEAQKRGGDSKLLARKIKRRKYIAK